MMAHDQPPTDPDHTGIDAVLDAMAHTDPMRAALFRHVAAMLTALDQALAPHGLYPLDDDAFDRVDTEPHIHDTPTFHVTRIGPDLLVTDAAGQLIAASGDLVALWALGAWAGVPGWMGDHAVETA